MALDDYYQFVTDDDQKLKRYYFEENVRDYLGENRTNTDIYSTLEDEKSPDFWLLNNGITILVSRAVLYDGKLDVENVQIVNGLQTTNTIYQYYSTHPQDKTGRCLLVKVICSTEEAIRHKIIQATNNQSTIPLYSLHATDKVQKDIEMVMLQYDLYYERKTNYYKNLNCDRDKIFSPLYLASGYVALILKLPHRAAMLKSKFMNNPVEYQRVFSEKSDLRVWPKIATILRSVDKEAEKNRARVKAGTDTYLRTVRPMVAILSVAKCTGRFCFSEQDLINLASIEQKVIEVIVDDVVSAINADETIRSIKDVRHPQKMKGIIETLGKKYGIPDFAGIRSRPDITANKSITEDFLKRVAEALPPQPWPMGIHKEIARQLECNPSAVSQAISIQVDRGVFRKQINGVLVDTEETQK